MYRALFFSLILILSHLNASPLEPTTLIVGQVLDAESQSPLTGVQVISGRQGDVTDQEGYFSFKGDVSLVLTIQHIGYQTLEVQGSERSLQIFMVPKILEGLKIIVRSGLKSEELIKQSASIAMLDSRDLKSSHALHFQGIMAQIPNLNFAGGTSRPRYFQIRGIGERSQFAGEGSPVFSVGFMFDDFDMTGISMNSFLFGIDQIEVYRGPQSSAFGPSALGGLIVMHSRKLPEALELKAQFSAGSYGLNEKAFTLGSTHLNGFYSHRLTAISNVHDGYTNNEYINRNDVNGKQEAALYYRGKVQLNHALKSTFSILHSESNNGYDAWSPNNKRISYTDQPGVDEQELRGYSSNTIWAPNQSNIFNVTLAQTNSEMLYAYDSDWANNEFWAQEPYNVEGWEYSYYDETHRDRLTQQLEAKWNHIPKHKNYEITSGLFIKSLTESDSARGYLFGGDALELLSEYEIDVKSAYFQLRQYLRPDLSILLNARVEQRQTDYSDDNLIEYTLKNKLMGWKSTLDYDLSRSAKLYVNYARGYKGGGVNQHPHLNAANRPYDPETIDNYEIGYRGQGHNYLLSTTFFYGLRKHQQVSLSRQQNDNDPNSFVYFTANAGTGYQAGLELEGDYTVIPQFELKGSLGLLKTYIDPYTFQVDSTSYQTLGGRAVAHAPAFSYRLGGAYSIGQNVDLGASIHGKDDFYYSDSHDQINQAYHLVDLNINYNSDRFEVSVWVKNIFNTDYGVKGFYFGLEPPNYEDKLYTQLGDPRQVGLTLDIAILK